MAQDILQIIRDTQFVDKSGAEALLLSFLRQNTPFDVLHVDLTPSAISLNSFNGFMYLADEQRLFFKSHTETDTIITEYYNAQLLHDAGYPIIQPIHSSTEAGKQLLIYEVIDDRAVFDIAWQLDTTVNPESHYSDQILDALSNAQQTADKDLFSIYKATEISLSANAVAQSPIHQLFYHRIVGGRLNRFYGDYTLAQDAEYPEVILPSGTVSMQTVRQVNWVINGQHYELTLQDLITQAVNLLQPEQEDITIIGHGDAHNGNVFFRGQANPPSLLYFDPAFAGKHSAFLDLAKPLFHNVFAMWMYYPHVVASNLEIEHHIQGNTWYITHNYALSPVRKLFLDSKITHTLMPYIAHLKERGQLRSNWRSYLKSALMCCPLLTMNLADNNKFPPSISLLGLSMAIEMGGESTQQGSLIDIELDNIEHALQRNSRNT